MARHGRAGGARITVSGMGPRVLALGCLLALGSFPVRGVAPSGQLVAWTLGPMVKLRPHALPPARPAASLALHAARNEFEAFQVGLRISGRDLASVDVEMSAFVGPHGRVLDAGLATVYREAFLTISRPSSIEGENGEWPDALLPRVDRYRGEARGSFPFLLPSGRTQPIWIDLYVPPGTPPGLYRGGVRISASGIGSVTLPVTLNVWSFTLPSTSSLPTAFGLSGLAAQKAHHGAYTNDDDLLEITSLYAKAALLHRLSTYGGTMAPPKAVTGRGSLEVDWSYYDREVGPLLDGTVLGADDPLPGARATSAEVRTPTGLDPVTKVAYWREWIRHFKARGWAERLYHYLWDEPAPRDYPEVLTLGRSAQQFGAELPNLLTLPYEPSLAPVVSIWTPVVNCFDDKPGRDRFCPGFPSGPRTYEPEIARGKRLWWYQSCASHGCNVVGGRYFTGWPSYVVDADAVAHRVMEWLTWRYGVQGELYYSMTEAFAGGADPWSDLLRYGGNGDGTLFYPGRPERIGGRTHIPIETIRLKLIREGLEDYEYFKLLADKGARAFVAERVGRVAPRTYSFQRDPAVLMAARHEIGVELDLRSR